MIDPMDQVSKPTFLSTSRRVRLIASNAAIADLAIGVASQIAALILPSWQVARGYAIDVGPSVVFHSVRIGDFRTCVTIEYTNASAMTGAYTIENCLNYGTRGNVLGVKSVQDVRTGEWVTLPNVCAGDRRAIAAALGVPKDVGVVAAWDGLCKSYGSVRYISIGFVCVAMLAALASAYYLYEVKYQWSSDHGSFLGQVSHCRCSGRRWHRHSSVADSRLWGQAASRGVLHPHSDLYCHLRPRHRMRLDEPASCWPRGTVFLPPCSGCDAISVLYRYQARKCLQMVRREQLAHNLKRQTRSTVVTP